jgi:GT2 family glycosyltransferase
MRGMNLDKAMDISNSFPKVSIIVSTYNRGKLLGSLIDSLLKQNYPHDKMEIIIINDGSKDDTKEILKQYPVKAINLTTNKGISYARNIGIKFSNGDIICITDDDCIADSNWVAEIVRMFSKDHEIDAVGGRIEGYRMETIFEKFAQFSKRPLITHSTLSTEKPIRFFFDYIVRFLSTSQVIPKNGARLIQIASSNCALKRDVLEEVGGFSTHFERSVDYDLSCRLNRLQKKMVYCNDAIIKHKHRSNLFDFIRKCYLVGKMHTMVCKFHSSPKLVYPLPIILVLSAIIDLFHSNYILSIFIIILYILLYMPYSLKIALVEKDFKLVLGLPILEIIREFVTDIGVFVGLATSVGQPTVAGNKNEKT